MSQVQSLITCDSCGKQYRWKPELAGRKVKCGCGAVLSVPSAAPADEEGLYDLAEDEPAPPQSGAVKAPVRGTVQPQAAPVAPAAARKPVAAVPPLAASQVPKATPPTAAAGRYYHARPVQVADEGARSAVKPLIALGVVLILIGTVFAFRFLLQSEPAPQLGEDAEVLRLIKDDGATELIEWLNGSSRRLVMGMTRYQAEDLANKFYGMGAKQVLAFGGVMSKSLAIELPDDPQQRKALFDWEHQWHEEMHVKPATDVGQKYLLLRMRV